MKTIRFENASVQYLAKGIILIGKCGDDRAIYLQTSKIRSLEFNRELLETNCSFQEDSITIVTDNDEFYVLENKSNKLSDILKQLLEFINV